MATSPTDRRATDDNLHADDMTAPVAPSPQNDDTAARRAAARRTAWVVAGVALAVYAGFIALNFFARQG